MKPSEMCLSLKTGIHFFQNEDGELVSCVRIVGEGFQLWTKTHGNWNEVVYYEEDGEQSGVGYKTDEEWERIEASFRGEDAW